MATKLQQILNVEGISKAALGKFHGLNPTTIHYLCKDPKYHKRTRDLTKHNVVSAIRELGRNRREYHLEDLFPKQ